MAAPAPGAPDVVAFAFPPPKEDPDPVVPPPPNKLPGFAVLFAVFPKRLPGVGADVALLVAFVVAFVPAKRLPPAAGALVPLPPPNRLPPAAGAAELEPPPPPNRPPLGGAALPVEVPGRDGYFLSLDKKCDLRTCVRSSICRGTKQTTSCGWFG